jgi:hypothetical protein
MFLDILVSNGALARANHYFYHRGIKRHGDDLIITDGSHATSMMSFSTPNVKRHTGGGDHFVANGLYARWAVSNSVTTNRAS